MTKLNFQQAKRDILKNTSKTRAFIDDIVDKDTFVEIGAFSFSSCDIVDEQGKEGVVTGYGLIDGIPCYLFMQNYEYMSGGFSESHAKKIENLYNLAKGADTPVICILDSFGAKLNEGIGCLDGYSKVLACVSNFSGTAPQICVVKGKASGIMSALPELCDLSIMLPAATKGASSQSVLSSKDNVKGEEILSSNNNLLKGNCDVICEQSKLKKTISTFLDLTIFSSKGESKDFDGNDNIKENISKEDLLKELSDSGDYFEFLKGVNQKVITSLFRLSGQTVAAIAIDGKLDCLSCRKIARFFNFANSFMLPIISFVNSDGVEVSKTEEESGLSREIAKLLSSTVNCQNAMISLVYGKATGVSYSTLVSKEVGYTVTLAWDSSIISPLSTETAVEIFYEDLLTKSNDKEALRKELKDRYFEEYGSAINSASNGYIDNIFEPKFTKNYLSLTLQMLANKFSFGVSSNLPL